MAIVPFIIVMVKIDMSAYDAVKDMWFNIAGYFLLQVTGLCWSYFAVRPYHKTKIQH